MILASASPRRSLLLSEAGLRFQIEPAGVDETLEAFAGPGGGPDPARVAEELFGPGTYGALERELRDPGARAAYGAAVGGVE